MATFIAVPGAAYVKLNMTLSAQQVQCTLGFEQVVFKTDFVSAELDRLCEGVYNWYSTEVMAYLSGDLVLRSVEAVDLSSQFASFGSYAPPVPADGSVATVSLPGNCAVCISFLTASRGRRARGRNFIPGVPKASLDGIDTVANTTLNPILTAYSEMETTINNGIPEAWRHIVISRADGLGARYAVTEYTFRDRVVDSQRRRLPGRGA